MPSGMTGIAVAAVIPIVSVMTGIVMGSFIISVAVVLVALIMVSLVVVFFVGLIVGRIAIIIDVGLAIAVPVRAVSIIVIHGPMPGV